MRLKYYLSARYSRRQELRCYAAELRKHRQYVTSSWLEEAPELAALATIKKFDKVHPLMRQIAEKDLEDIDESDTLIFFSEPSFPGHPRGSRHVEFGYALGQRKDIITIGPLENPFHHLYGIRNYPDWKSFMEAEFGVNYAN
jgi:hypothetical protein